MRIKKGDVLKFKFGEDVYSNIVSEVIDPNSIRPVKYKGKGVVLSVAAKNVLKQKFDTDWKLVQGTIFWTFNCKATRELMDERGL